MSFRNGFLIKWLFFCAWWKVAVRNIDVYTYTYNVHTCNIFFFNSAKVNQDNNKKTS